MPPQCENAATSTRHVQCAVHSIGLGQSSRLKAHPCSEEASWHLHSARPSFSQLPRLLLQGLPPALLPVVQSWFTWQHHLLG